MERPRSEVFALQDDVTKEVSIFLRQQLGEQVIDAGNAGAGTSNTQGVGAAPAAGGLRRTCDT